MAQTGPFKWERMDKRCWLLQNSLLSVQTRLRHMSLRRKRAAEVVVVVPFITGSVRADGQFQTVFRSEGGKQNFCHCAFPPVDV